ncbi:hypothetical protein [Kocuria rosea]|uniref:hypothetical protein n=1 Tax=Kocuria rosea TaxID=1275 RepID=UPI00254081BF|nr:hypothetical protein [Kocuria rosea]WIG19315.1 hypothetical protein QOY29_18225 [Kocuria rosea]
MKYENEDDVKEALGIKSWDDVPKDKMRQLVLMTRDMDAELAARIVDKLPVYEEFGTSALSALRKMHKRTLAANSESHDNFYQSCRITLETYNAELSKDGTTFEQKKYFMEQIQVILRMKYQKDSENKQFLDGIMGKILVSALALGGAYVGARMVNGAKDSSQDDDIPDSLTPPPIA